MMKNRLKHNRKFCEIGEMLDFSSVDLIQNFDSILIGKCTDIHKTHSIEYVFRIKEYNPSYNIVKSRVKNFKRSILNKYYKDGNIQEVSNSLLAKIKLMEGYR